MQNGKKQKKPIEPQESTEIILKRYFPELAAAFEQWLTINRNTKLGDQLRTRYYDRYETAKRPGKNIPLETVVNILLAHGAKVTIHVEMPQITEPLQSS